MQKKKKKKSELHFISQVNDNEFVYYGRLVFWYTKHILFNFFFLFFIKIYSF